MEPSSNWLMQRYLAHSGELSQENITTTDSERNQDNHTHQQQQQQQQQNLASPTNTPKSAIQMQSNMEGNPSGGMNASPYFAFPPPPPAVQIHLPIPLSLQQSSQSPNPSFQPNPPLAQAFSASIFPSAPSTTTPPAAAFPSTMVIGPFPPVNNLALPNNPIDPTHPNWSANFLASIGLAPPQPSDSLANCSRPSTGGPSNPPGEGVNYFHNYANGAAATNTAATRSLPTYYSNAPIAAAYPPSSSIADLSANAGYAHYPYNIPSTDSTPPQPIQLNYGFFPLHPSLPSSLVPVPLAGGRGDGSASFLPSSSAVADMYSLNVPLPSPPPAPVSMPTTKGKKTAESSLAKKSKLVRNGQLSIDSMRHISSPHTAPRWSNDRNSDTTVSANEVVSLTTRIGQSSSPTQQVRLPKLIRNIEVTTDDHRTNYSNNDEISTQSPTNNSKSKSPTDLTLPSGTNINIPVATRVDSSTLLTGLANKSKRPVSILSAASISPVTLGGSVSPVNLSSSSVSSYPSLAVSYHQQDFNCAKQRSQDLQRRQRTKAERSTETTKANIIEQQSTKYDAKQESIPTSSVNPTSEGDLIPFTAAVHTNTSSSMPLPLSTLPLLTASSALPPPSPGLLPYLPTVPYGVRTHPWIRGLKDPQLAPLALKSSVHWSEIDRYRARFHSSTQPTQSNDLLGIGLSFDLPSLTPKHKSHSSLAKDVIDALTIFRDRMSSMLPVEFEANRAKIKSNIGEMGRPCPFFQTIPFSTITKSKSYDIPRKLTHRRAPSDDRHNLHGPSTIEQFLYPTRESLRTQVYPVSLSILNAPSILAANSSPDYPYFIPDEDRDRPAPPSNHYTTIRRNITKEDDKRLRFIPYFGDEEGETVDASMYGELAIESEDDEIVLQRDACLLAVCPNYPDNEKTFQIIASTLNKALAPLIPPQTPTASKATTRPRKRARRQSRRSTKKKEKKKKNRRTRRTVNEREEDDEEEEDNDASNDGDDDDSMSGSESSDSVSSVDGLLEDSSPSASSSLHLTTTPSSPPFKPIALRQRWQELTLMREKRSTTHFQQLDELGCDSIESIAILHKLKDHLRRSSVNHDQSNSSDSFVDTELDIFTHPPTAPLASKLNLTHSFETHFCRRCFVFDCRLHGRTQPRIHERKLPLEVELKEVERLNLVGATLRQEDPHKYSNLFGAISNAPSKLSQQSNTPIPASALSSPVIPCGSHCFRLVLLGRQGSLPTIGSTSNSAPPANTTKVPNDVHTPCSSTSCSMPTLMRVGPLLGTMPIISTLASTSTTSPSGTFSTSSTLVMPEWSEWEKLLLRKLIYIFGPGKGVGSYKSPSIYSFPYCSLSAALGSKTCSEILTFVEQTTVTAPFLTHAARRAQEVARSVAEPAIGSTEDSNSKVGRGKKRKRRTGTRAALQLRLKAAFRRSLRNLPHAHVACDHPNQPCDETTLNCQCAQNELFCEKYCACSPTCTNRFVGCNCSRSGSQCHTRACPCFAANRECDPDLCKNCHVEGDEEEEEGGPETPNQVNTVDHGSMSEHVASDANPSISTESTRPSTSPLPTLSLRPSRHCLNASLQSGFRHPLLLGESDVHGWGCFLGPTAETPTINSTIPSPSPIRDGGGIGGVGSGVGGTTSTPITSSGVVRKNSLLTEYFGELISQEEADRRGRIYDRLNRSYLFNLNAEYVVDAARKGNKIKFANHSQTPNCYSKVMLVNGSHRIGIYAQKTIKPGEELLFDYQHEHSGTKPSWLEAEENKQFHPSSTHSNPSFKSSGPTGRPPKSSTCAKNAGD